VEEAPVKRYKIGSGVTQLKYSHPGNASGKRGGARPGTGNNKGPRPGNAKPYGPNAKSKAIRAKAVAGKAAVVALAESSGELPHEFLLRVMRTKVGEEVDGTKITWDDRIYAAVSCINYYAPKLTTVNVQGKNNPAPVRIMNVNPNNLVGLSVEELVILEKVFARWEAGDVTDLSPSIIDGSVYEETLQ